MSYLKLWKRRDLFQKSGESFLAVLILNAKQPHKYKKRAEIKNSCLLYTSRVFVYTPLIDEKEYIKEESSSFLKKFYDGALNSMVLNFIDGDKLSLEDMEELTRILEKGRRG